LASETGGRDGSKSQYGTADDNEVVEEADEPVEVVKQPVKAKPVPIVQNVEIDLDADGRTVSKWWPPHQYVETRARMEEEPVYVRRHFYFFCAVPPEYHWLTDDPDRRGPKSEFWRTMPYAEWMKWVEMEELRGDGHLMGD